MLVLALWLGGWLLAADTSRFTSELAVAYTADVMSPLAGASVRPVWMDNVDVTLTLHLTPRTTLFLYGLGNQGGSISARVGDAQGVSNIEAPTSWRLYEAFVEHVTATGRLSVLAGLYDLNSEFDVLPAAGLFINSSFGIGAELAASRPQGPSIFPVTSPGLRLRLGFQRSARYAGYLQAVALDGGRDARTALPARTSSSGVTTACCWWPKPVRWCIRKHRCPTARRSGSSAACTNIPIITSWRWASGTTPPASGGSTQTARNGAMPASICWANRGSTGKAPARSGPFCGWAWRIRA
ncbi:carbohydrate porin [Rhodothermus marinus]|uniref:carbohydrate porin n=1 Tax=Rhodothermus marinus TaxID=29549 RepID=UPI001D9E83E6|nr:carbohydrate porin [Rhodothermus marinus]MBO2492503.1 hypothetical protein [Rhodothermus marinus]